MQSTGGKDGLVIVTNPLLAARLRGAVPAEPSPLATSGDAQPPVLSTSPGTRSSRSPSPPAAGLRRKRKDHKEKEKGRSWDADDLAHELQPRRTSHSVGGHNDTVYHPRQGSGGEVPVGYEWAAVGGTKRSNSVAAATTSAAGPSPDKEQRDSPATEARDRAASFLKRLSSLEKRKSHDLDPRSMNNKSSTSSSASGTSPSPSPRQSVVTLAIARRKNAMEGATATALHDSSEGGAGGAGGEGDDNTTPRKRAFSTAACSASSSSMALGSPKGRPQGRMVSSASGDINGSPAALGGSADMAAVPFLNLRKMATRDDSRYHTLHGGELFTPVDASPEEKLHRLLVSPGLEVVNSMEDILPSALRPELAAALVSVFEGCGRDQNLLMWAIQKEIDMCSRLQAGDCWLEMRTGMATHVLTSWFLLHSQSFLSLCLRPIILKLTTEERLEAVALPASDSMRQEFICECLQETLEGLAASAAVLPHEVRFVLILAQAEMTKLHPELGPLIVARLFFSCFLLPALSTCESSIPNFNADGYSLDFIGRHFLRVMARGLSCLAARFTITEEDDALAFLNNNESSDAVVLLRERIGTFVAGLSTRSSGDSKKTPKKTTSTYLDTMLTDGGSMGALFKRGNEWNDDRLFFFVFGAMRERMIEALTKNNKALFAAKLYNLLDKSFKGQDTVLALKQRQHVINEYVTHKYGKKVPLVHWRQRSRKRVDGASGGRRLAIREVLLDRRNNSSGGGGGGGGDLPPNSPHFYSHRRRGDAERPSKSLLKLMICDQRQKNQEIEDELRLTKLKLQQEIKAKRELQLQLLRRDNDNNEMKKTAEQTLQEWTEVQALWELMGKQMAGLEQALFPLDDDIQRIGSSGSGEGGLAIYHRNNSSEQLQQQQSRKKKLLPFSGFKRQSASVFSSQS